MVRAAIFSHLPALQVPWVSLDAAPPRFCATPHPRLWLLDEGGVGTLYGGNKVRKLEFLLGRVLARGQRQLLTLGAAGSHHVLATALYAARLGLQTHAVLVPQPHTPHAEAGLRQSAAACASLTPCLSAAGLPLVLARCVARHPDAAWIPLGGSSAWGTLGWVSAGLALADALRAGHLPPLRQVVVALGSGGTAAGLLLGLRLAGLSSPEVVAVRVVDRPLGTAIQTRLQARRCLALLRAHGAAVPSSLSLGGLRVDDSWLAGGYGHADARTRASQAAGERLGLAAIEQTYTAKALGAALAAADAAQGDVLYVHTLSSRAPPLPEAAPLPSGLARLLVRETD